MRMAERPGKAAGALDIGLPSREPSTIVLPRQRLTESEVTNVKQLWKSKKKATKWSLNAFEAIDFRRRQPILVVLLYISSSVKAIANPFLPNDRRVAMDVRTTLSAEKHYINMPMPLFLYLSSLDITKAQESIFWIHWGEGQIRGDWTSQIPIKTVATRLSLSERSVKRGYQVLVKLGLLRRVGQGRSVRDPMKAAVTKTEVLIPETVADELLAAPNRAAAYSAPPCTKTESDLESTTSDNTELQLGNVERPDAAKAQPCYVSIDDPEAGASFHRLGSQKSRRDISEWKDAPELRTAPLGLTDFLEWALTGGGAGLFTDRYEAMRVYAAHVCHLKFPKRRSLYPGYVYKLRRDLSEKLNYYGEELHRLWNEIVWEMQSGDFADMPAPKARNIIMKSIRMNKWRKPYGMPEDWTWSACV